ncbi:MAG TPA: sterol desaturase family protein [Acetobacteraceae bacterium]|nr:sterol desaturase family protein [Acetobacteraceae bacterium]
MAMLDSLIATLREHQLLGTALSLLHAFVWLFLLAVIFVPLEQLFGAKREQLFRLSTLSDLGFYFISDFVPSFLLVFPLSLAAYISYHCVPWRIHADIASWPLWLRGLSAFIVGDFGFYWGHRWAHQIPLLWRFHAVHHRPKHVYFLISARAHPIDSVFIRLCGLVPIYMLGLGAPQSVQGTMIATLLMLLITVWGFFIHADIRWRFGPLEWLLATPPFHHWHHTLAEPRDRNFASMLPCWDWLFGTHYLPRHWPSSYGTDTVLPDSLAGQLIHPFRPAPAAAPATADR